MRLKLFAPILVLVVILAGCLALAADQNDTSAANTNKLATWRPKILSFATYQKLYHKVYSSYSELLRRSTLFYSRMMRIFVVGVKYLRKKSTMFLRPNALSDRTEEERMKLLSNDFEELPPASDKDVIGNDEVKSSDTSDSQSPVKDTTATKSSEETSQASGADALLPKMEHIGPKVFDLSTLDERKGQTEVFLDYRDTGCITPIKNQRECGACYIFATFAVYEYLYCTQHGKQLNFSVQYAVDCGKRELNSGGMNGCDGGREDYVAHFVANYGLEHEASYPFKVRDDTCPYEVGTDKAKMGQTRVKHTALGFGNDRDLMYSEVLVEVLKKHGPFVIGIYVADDLADYGGGIDMVPSCIKPHGHAMTVVGHGIDDGHEYFLIKNSMGTDWGEQGYYRMSKHFNTDCLDHFTYTKAEFSENESYDNQTLGNKIHQAQQ